MNEESTTTTEKKGLWRAHAAPPAAYARVAVCLTRGSWAGRGRKANRGSGDTGFHGSLTGPALLNYTPLISSNRRPPWTGEQILDVLQNFGRGEHVSRNSYIA